MRFGLAFSQVVYSFSIYTYNEEGEEAALFGFISNARLYMTNVNFFNHHIKQGLPATSIIHLTATFIPST